MEGEVSVGVERRGNGRRVKGRRGEEMKGE